MTLEITNIPAENVESGDPNRGRDWYRHRATGRRYLLLAWCIWLIISWTATLTTQSIKVAATVTMPFSALIGLMLMWPILRLSQQFEPPVTVDPNGRLPATGQQQLGIFREWLQLNIVFQAVVWPLMLNAEWTIEQTAWLDVTIASWSLLAALITDWGCRSTSGWTRLVAMIICLLLLFAEPALMGLSNMATTSGQAISWTMKISPIRIVWDMTRQYGGASRFQQHIPLVLATMAAGIVGWVVWRICLLKFGWRLNRG